MLKETIETITINLKRAQNDFNEIKSWDNISPDYFDNDEKRRVIDSFIFRFTKLQDLMGDKLFKEVLNSIGEYKRSMSFIDVLDKLEKLEIIKDADEWNGIRELRNNLSQEYPSNQDEIIKDIKLALVLFEKIADTYKNIISYIDKNKLI